MSDTNEQTGLRILQLEDVPADAELVEAALRAAGLAFTSRRVDAREAFVRALEEFKPDIVLADYNLPSFDGGSAVKIVRQQHPEIPVVIVTGTVGDEKAVELLRLGAKDYVLKDKLARLGPAVLRALEEEKSLRSRKRAEAQILKLTRLYATLSHVNQAIVRATDREKLLCDICEGAVNHGKFAMAWVGLADKATRMVKPACRYGAGQDFLADIAISIDDVPAGQGLTGTAIRENRICHMNDFAADARALPWRDALLERGFRGGAGIPLRFGNKAIGALALYTGEPDFFDADQLNLLEEIATDIGFALDNLHREARRRGAEEKLAESERHFRAVAESANDAIITAADDGNITGWNAAAERLFGYTGAEIIGRNLTALMPERFREPHSAGLARVASGEAPRVIGKTVELAGLRRDGSEFPLELSLAQWQTHKGRFFAAIIRDIGERKRNEKLIDGQFAEILRAGTDLKKRNVFVETLLENAPIGFAVYTVDDGRFTFVSSRFAAVYGVPPGSLETVGDFFEKVYPDPALREQIRARVMADIASGDAARMHWEDVPITGPDGSCRFISAANIPLPEQNLMISMVWDVTDRHKAEESLRESEEIFSRFMEFSPIYVFFKDENIRALRLSKNFETMLGKPMAELLGKTMYELFPPDLAQSMIADDMRILKEGREITVEEELGGRFYSTTKFPIFIEGKARFIAGYTTDITEYKRLAERQAMEYRNVTEINAQLKKANRQLELAQTQLLQSEKMASIGQLAAGVAHEINNPVGYVNSNLGTLEKYLADIFAVMDKYEAVELLMGMLAEADDPLLEELRQFKKKIDLGYLRKDIKALLAESHQGLERVKKIVLDLKNFSRAESEEQWVMADIQQGMETTLNVVWNELKYKCEVVKEYAPLPKVMCLPSQLDQVFMNLLVNAAHAIEVRGKITIRTGQEGERVWIEVNDTGKGIPPEDMPRLFDPFFTTKPVGKGTGLGLSVSYNIVEKHHGNIEVHSEVGRGSTFRVWLPVQQPGIKEVA